MQFNSLFDETMLSFGKRPDIGILTLWTKKEEILKHLSQNNFSVISQLYSRVDGVNQVIRNLLFNKQIRYLIITGKDMTRSGEALKSFFINGVNENNKIQLNDNTTIKIDNNIPKEKIDEIRRKVILLDLRNLQNHNELNTRIETLEKKEAWGDSEKFPHQTKQDIDQLPSESSNFIIRGDYIGDIWLEILDKVLKFGQIKKTEYGNSMCEVVNLIAVVKKEDPENPLFKSYFNFTEKELKDYIPKVTRDTKLEGIEYTYGSRMRSHFGFDQIQHVTNYLKQTPFTRRAVFLTWDPKKDAQNPKCPCVSLLQYLIQENKLYLTVYIRSNDMFGAWPLNAFALRQLQKETAKDLGIELGDLTTISSSAHIYDNVFNTAQTIINENKKSKLNLDPRGNIIITLEQPESSPSKLTTQTAYDINYSTSHLMTHTSNLTSPKSKLITIKHLSPKGGVLRSFKSKSAKEAYMYLIKHSVISSVEHAFDIGCELQKAEVALKLGKEYIQDRKLQI